MKPRFLLLALVLASLIPTTASAAARVQVLAGSTPDTRIMPSNSFTVADASQLTGIRVNLPVPVCNATNSSVCDDLNLLNLQDGFDLRPRVTVPFTGPIDVSTVTALDFYVTGPAGFRTPVTQLVWDPVTDVLAGEPSDFLVEATNYSVVVTSGIKDTSGRSVIACTGSCTSAFTTETATPELAKLRASLDSGDAYARAGITDRGATFVQGGVRDVFPAATVTEIERGDQVYADPTKPLSFSLVPNSAVTGVGYYAFGSFLVPRFQTYSDAVIPHVPTTQTPSPIGAQRVGFTLIVPAGTAPAGGWPVAIFGPGFTRSKYDLFLAADLNAAKGIATMATDPAGHAYGPASVAAVHQGALTTTFSGFGQGADLDGDGDITASEGVGPTDHKTVDANGNVIADAPSRFATVGLRDGLIQTAVNVMTMVRVVEHGVDVLGDGTVTLQRHVLAYYGQSFGAIYGTMVMATDTHLSVGVLNVGGGPIVEIARLSGFRNLLADQLRVSRPALLNGGPGLNGFTESMPLRLDPAVTNPYPGATTIQKYFDHANWQERAGDPVAFAPLIRLRPPAGSLVKHVIWQSAFGDHTVPNPTAGELYRAGHVFDLVSYYRNDKTPTAGTDPHGFLLDPRLFGRDQGQAQVLAFISSGGATVIDPDGPGPIWEVPIANTRNLDCTHYPEPSFTRLRRESADLEGVGQAALGVLTQEATSMPDTIAALFKDEAQADSAVRALKSADFDSSEIEIRGPREPELPDFGGNAARGVAFGSIGGTVLGLVLGTLAAGMVPGSHAYVQGGWFVPFMLAMALGATGGLAGLLLSVGASRYRALYYEQEVQSGRYLVNVDTQPERRETARQILLSKGALEAAPIDSPTVKRGGRRVVE